MNDIIVMKIVDGLKDLSNGLRGILLGELSILADSIEQLSASC